jgi:hypothetical protein
MDAAMTPSLHQACEAFKKTYGRALREHPEDIRTVDELDQMIHQARAVIGSASMTLSVQAAREAVDVVCSCGGRGVIERRPSAELRSMQGRHCMEGVALRCALCCRVWHPVHERLGIEGQHHSTVLFERLSSDFILDKGSPAAARRLKEHHGIEVGRTTVLQHAEQRGVEACEFIGQKLAGALDQSEARRGQPLRVAEVFVQMDSSSGKTVSKLDRPTVDDDPPVERTPVRGLVKVQRPVEGKQVKLLCAQAKGEASWAYQAYIGEFDEAVVPLQGLAATRGWQDGTLAVMTSDGEPSIQEVGHGAFDPNFRFVLDHPHAMTHLGDVPLHAPDLLSLPKEEWLKYATARLHQGEVLKLVDEIRAMANQLPEGEDRTKVENVAIYFEMRASATHCDAFKEHDWPIASGNVEGGHRTFIHPVTKRGTGWLVENLNAVVALACVRKNEWWDEFWTFVASRRQERRVAAEAAKKAA